MSDPTPNDADLFAAVRDAVNPAVQAALQHGPLPSLRSPEFTTAPPEVRLAVLAACGISYVFAADTLATWLGDDYADGRFHRTHVLLPALGELNLRRYPPTGDRDLWITYGPDGPPAEREGAPEGSPGRGRRRYRVRHPPRRIDAVPVTSRSGADSTNKLASYATKTHSHDSSAQQDLELVTVGEYLPPAGRRTLPAALARHCPDCGAATVHRGVVRGETKWRVGTCGHAYRFHVPGPIYGADHDCTDLWADQDGTVYRGSQSWVPRAS